MKQNKAKSQPLDISGPKLKLPYLNVPEGDLFNSVEKGFVPFWRLEQTMNSSRRSKTQHDQLINLLQDNRKKLGKLNTSVAMQRQQQYEEYIKNSHRYSKLLQLNTRRLATLSQLSKNKVGEVKVKHAQEIRMEDILYEANLTKIMVQGWKPESREGQVCVAYKDYIVLFGGHNSTPLSNICFFSVKENAWVKVNRSELNRSYHTGLLYRGHYVVMFGGLTGPIGYAKDRECLSTSCLYDISSGLFRTIKVSNQEIVEPRRNHGAAIFGKFMVVFGGINNKNKCLNDFKYLDLKELKWYAKEYKISDEETQKFLEKGLSRHSIQTNFYKRQNYQMYSSSYQQTQGIFLFGGCNQSGQYNTLLQIRFNKFTPVLHRLDPAGIHPSSIEPLTCRYNESTFLLLSGQRTQRQLYLYKIQQNQFVTVENRASLSSLGGIGSSLVACRDSFYVMFGVGEHGYMGTVTGLMMAERKKEVESRQKARVFMEAMKRYSLSASSGEKTVFDV